MSKKANPTVIGLFVVLSAALAVAGVILFSSARWFSSTRAFIVYFDASVNGLDVGAPVKFRGLTIGRVNEILLRHNQETQDTAMPVLLELNQELLSKKSDRTLDLHDEELFGKLVEEGLRAKLELESFVTGRLYISLELVRDAGPPVLHQIQKEELEIPSAPTEIQQLMRNVAEFDLAGLNRRLDAVLDQLIIMLEELKVRDISHGLTNLIASLTRVVDSPRLTNTLSLADQALEEVRHLSETVRNRVHPMADNADAALRDASSTLAELRKALEEVRDMLAPQASFRRDLDRAVEQLSRAAQSVGGLADSLTRNPNAILSGRQPKESP